WDEIVVPGARPGQVLRISAYSQRRGAERPDGGDQRTARTWPRAKGPLEQRILDRESERHLAHNRRRRAPGGRLALGGALGRRLARGWTSERGEGLQSRQKRAREQR